jgi:hypothetical protein
MKLNILAMGTLILTSFNSLAFADKSCVPFVDSYGRETVTEIADTKITGLFAANEMKGKNLTVYRDFLGRVMFVESKEVLKTIDGTTPELSKKDVFPGAQIVRYCSKTDDFDAVCVDLCVRWTNYGYPGM